MTTRLRSKRKTKSPPVKPVVPTGIRKLLYSKREAAWVSGQSVRTINYRIQSGALKTIQHGRRRLIHVTELERFTCQDCA